MVHSVFRISISLIYAFKVVGTALSRMWKSKWDQSELNELTEGLADNLYAKVHHASLALPFPDCSYLVGKRN